MSRFFVTGATGFLGSHLVDRLVDAGHQVVALSRSGAPALEAKGVEVARGDILESESVLKAADGCEGAFHCAGQVSRDRHDAGRLYDVHVEGTKATLKALAKTSVKRVVVASTSGVVAVSRDADTISSESSPTPMELIAPWPYYRSKLFAEQAALEFDGPDLEVVAVNPSLLLGPGDLRGSSSQDVTTFLEGKMRVVPGGGIAFVDVRDAAAGMLAAYHQGQRGHRYLLNGANMTLSAFFARLSRISGVAEPALSIPTTKPGFAGTLVGLLRQATRGVGVELGMDEVTAEMAQCFWYCTAEKAKNALAWSSRDPGETLLDTVNDLESRGVVWPLRADA